MPPPTAGAWRRRRGAPAGDLPRQRGLALVVGPGGRLQVSLSLKPILSRSLSLLRALASLHRADAHGGPLISSFTGSWRSGDDRCDACRWHPAEPGASSVAWPRPASRSLTRNVSGNCTGFLTQSPEGDGAVYVTHAALDENAAQRRLRRACVRGLSCEVGPPCGSQHPRALTQARAAERQSPFFRRQ
jgi:hypothetical protein